MVSRRGERSRYAVSASAKCTHGARPAELCRYFEPHAAYCSRIQCWVWSRRDAAAESPPRLQAPPHGSSVTAWTNKGCAGMRPARPAPRHCRPDSASREGTEPPGSTVGALRGLCGGSAGALASPSQSSVALDVFLTARQSAGRAKVARSQPEAPCQTA